MLHLLDISGNWFVHIMMLFIFCVRTSDNFAWHTKIINFSVMTIWMRHCEVDTEKRRFFWLWMRVYFQFHFKLNMITHAGKISTCYLQMHGVMMMIGFMSCSVCLYVLVQIWHSNSWSKHIIIKNSPDCILSLDDFQVNIHRPFCLI